MKRIVWTVERRVWILWNLKCNAANLHSTSLISNNSIIIDGSDQIVKKSAGLKFTFFRFAVRIVQQVCVLRFLHSHADKTSSVITNYRDVRKL